MITLTDIDFYFILDTYNIEKYEIVESYSSVYNYLPKKFINFVLKKYVSKTKLKNIEGKEIEYAIEKNKFNSLYGMSVTNNIRDEVTYDNFLGWNERELTNTEIVDKLDLERKKGFLSFAYGVWVTAYARNNILRNLIKMDSDVVYCDTDSLKLKQGYDINIINEYNKFVERKIKFISNKLKIDINKFAPEDIKGKKHILGIFEKDNFYDEFITQGAKKYAYKIGNKIGITVSGVPVKGAKALKDLKDFNDGFVFKFDDTGKSLLVYTENQKPVIITDYQGNTAQVNDKKGCCIIPTTYVLGKSNDYTTLVNSESSRRAKYKE